MKALITKGKHTGKEVEISQWCNDWFTTNTGVASIDTKPFSPTSLAFTFSDFRKIQAHKNNGTLFDEFEPRELNGALGAYEMTFKRKGRPKENRTFLTSKEALELLPNGEEIHVFHNPGFGLLGFDVSRERVIKTIEEAETREVGGKACVGMGHGLVVIPKDSKLQSDIWFINHSEEAIKKYL